MPSGKYLLVEFIKAIPDEAICPPKKDQGRLHGDANFQLDSQGVTLPPNKHSYLHTSKPTSLKRDLRRLPVRTSGIFRFRSTTDQEDVSRRVRARHGGWTSVGPEKEAMDRGPNQTKAVEYELSDQTEGLMRMGYLEWSETRLIDENFLIYAITMIFMDGRLGNELQQAAACSEEKQSRSLVWDT